ncbi:MAG: carboxypeptidase-like regulatory domain-containing protein [Planctomycetota bacterium]
MRALILLVLCAAIGAAAWTFLDSPPPSAGAGPLRPSGALTPASTQPVERRMEAQRGADSAASAQLAATSTAAAASTPTPQLPSAPPGHALASATTRATVEGDVRDRLGAPVAGERVWLLATGVPFPPADARLTDYVTARTGQTGAFSLTAPGPGPWRLAVGAPGEPRFEPSPPRVLAGPARAAATISGTAALRIVFEGLPAGDEPVALEVLALRDPSAAPGQGRGNAGNGRRGRGNGAAGVPADPAAGNTGRRGRTRPQGDATDQGASGGSDIRGAQATPSDGEAPRAQLASVQQPTPQGARRNGRGQGQGQPGAGQPGGAAQGGRARGSRGQGGPPNGGAAASGEQDDAPQGPPPEVWRALVRRTLTPEERASGSVELTGLRPGATARLALRIGDDTLEGQTRFLLAADAVIEVRVFPLTQPMGSGLSYVALPLPVAPDATPIGARWVD